MKDAKVEQEQKQRVSLSLVAENSAATAACYVIHCLACNLAGLVPIDAGTFLFWLVSWLVGWLMLGHDHLLI